jgi:ClpP class serine protease|nr:MAG TPA: periplasmic serine protease [Caudoviricetes sp.]
MPTWDEILHEIGSTINVLDLTRRKYVKDLSAWTGRNTIIYYSAFLQKPQLSKKGVDFSINDNDKMGFMTVVNKLDKSKGLDLILHTPGGSVAATESIVSYLKMIFGDDIRAIVPQMAMSAGTMIACSCKSVVMGKQSSLGPIDPQFGIVSAHAIKEEFERIINEVKTDPSKIIVWREILQKYNPTLIGECEKAIKWSKEMVRGWLESNMLKHDKVKAQKVVDFLSSHQDTYTHDRHLDFNTLNQLGLVIEKLEDDQELQDKVLSVHHSTIISMSQTQATKIIENNMGKAYIQSV